MNDNAIDDDKGSVEEAKSINLESLSRLKSTFHHLLLAMRSWASHLTLVLRSLFEK